MNINPVNLIYQKSISHDFEITIDVELLSLAFNEIFQNALDATENDLDKIDKFYRYKVKISAINQEL